jgi:MraZ protein
MFTGEFNHSLDSKNRIFIPSKHREELGETFMVVRSIRENCIKVYSMAEWDNFLRPIMELPRKTSEQTLRFLHRNATQVTPDSQGRILLSQGLVDHAQIKKNAVIVGCGSYAEIWSEANYMSSVESEDIESIRLALEEAGL